MAKSFLGDKEGNMTINKIILASSLLLVGCSSTQEPELVYEDGMPIIDEQIAPENDKIVVRYVSSAQTSTAKQNNSAQPRKDNVFTLLNHNHRQVSRLYADTTKKIYLGRPEVVEEEVDEGLPPIEEVEEETVEVKDYTADCITYCGEGFYYDHDGEQLNGHERICIKYPLPCGEECRKDWYTQSLIYDTNYTCQEAIQKESNDEKAPEAPATQLKAEEGNNLKNTLQEATGK